MSDECLHFALSSKDSDAPAPVLVGVQAHGRLDAVLFELTFRQTYRNTSDRVLEVVYTFPLPPLAVLLGFASELNGVRQEGVIVAKRVAERQYEESLEAGDAPVMLEAHANGLHTANIGNLKPGDEIVLEARFAQLISFDQGRLRVSIPTTIAPRYGHAEQAGLQPQQVPLASLAAEYPLALTLTIGEALAGATTECPTHRFETRRAQDGSTILELAADARLDRDVVVIVTPREPRPSLLIRADDAFNASAPRVMMAALQPAALTPRKRISLKLLVDCSGSMSGDSITSARAALRGVVAGLSEDDWLSLSRFGTTVEHLFAPSLAKPQALRYLRPLIDDMQADLGGTEMEEALRAVFELPRDADQSSSDVLLITDGQIWQSDELVAAARSSRHRVFAIGVGSSPAEGVLRALAEATGGACEFATPGESLEAAAQRMLIRMRPLAFTNARIDWGCTPAWTSGPSSFIFDGDTVIALAGFSDGTKPHAIRLLAEDVHGKTVELARVEAEAPCSGDRLSRIAAARRMAQSSNADALALAVQYQLMSRQTNCILVHERAEAEKTAEQAELHRVSSMAAAGWGGIGSVSPVSLSTPYYSIVDYDSMEGLEGSSSMWAAPPLQAPSAEKDFNPAEDAMALEWAQALSEARSKERPARAGEDDSAQQRPAEVNEATPTTLENIARLVAEHLAAGEGIESLGSTCAALTLHEDLQQALAEAVTLGLRPEQFWLLLAFWVSTRTQGPADAGIAIQLQPLIETIDADMRTAALEVLEEGLAAYFNDSWELSFLRTLRHSLAQT